MNGIIYKITNTKTNQFYIGSSLTSVEVRFQRHLDDAFVHKSPQKIHANMREHGKTAFKIEVLESVQVSTYEELHTHEGRVQWEQDAMKGLGLNAQIAGRTKEQYAKDNKEEYATRALEWYNRNKEVVKMKRKEEVTCECGAVVTRAALGQHRKSKKHLGIVTPSPAPS
jgi:group I intron endonuclease